MKSKKSIIITCALLAFAFVIFQPYTTVFKIKSAVKKQDGEALSDHVDFPSLRQSLKEQINIMLTKEMGEADQDSSFTGLGVLFGGALSDRMVDMYITPAGLSELMKKGNVHNSTAPDSEPFANAKLSYKSFSKFHISTVDPEAGEELKFILRRKGFSWKLTGILITPHTPQPTKNMIIGDWDGNNYFSPKKVREISDPPPPYGVDISDTFTGIYSYSKDGTYHSEGKYLRKISQGNQTESLVYSFESKGIWELRKTSLIKTTHTISIEPSDDHTREVLKLNPMLLDQLKQNEGKEEIGEILIITDSKLKVRNSKLDYTFTKKR